MEREQLIIEIDRLADAAEKTVPGAAVKEDPHKRAPIPRTRYPRPRREARPAARRVRTPSPRGVMVRARRALRVVLCSLALAAVNACVPPVVQAVSQQLRAPEKVEGLVRVVMRR